MVDEPQDIGIQRIPPAGAPMRRNAPRRATTRRFSLAAIVALGALLVVATGVAFTGNRDDEAATTAERVQQNEATTGEVRSSTDTVSSSRIVPIPMQPVEAVAVADVSVDDERLVIIDGPSTIFMLDLHSGTRTEWATPEPLVAASPITVAGTIVILGETQAWVAIADESLTLEPPTWAPLGPADRVRFSTKPDRVWLRTINDKEDPTDAEFLWNEVDLRGEVQRSMFRNRPLYFPTPEFISGLGSNIFRFTDAEVNPWRLFSPFGVPIALGRNDLIANECNTRIECGRVWYDLVSGEKRGSVYEDAANAIDASYGTLLSPDGRFLISELERPDAESLAFVRSVVTGRVIANDCRWDAPFAWSRDSRFFLCRSAAGLELHATNETDRPSIGSQEVKGRPRPLAQIAMNADPEESTFTFASLTLNN